MRWRQYLPTRERAQSSGIIVFALIIGVSALVWGLANPAMQDVADKSLNSTSDQEAKDIINERLKIWDNMLFFTLVFAGIVLLTRAIVQSRVG